MNPPIRTFLIGLMGRGIGGSRSREIHEREAEALNLPLVYRNLDFDLIGYDDCKLPAVVELLASIGFDGFNVTHPFKRRILVELDEVSPEAAVLGAVNTVVFKSGRRCGFNTDWSGFQASMTRDLPGVALGEVANIGCGGAGAATTYALLKMGAVSVRLFDQDRGRAEWLAESLSSAFPHQSLRIATSAAEALEGADGVVQTTPVGMTSHPGVPFDPDALRPAMWLADLVYFPRETQLLRAARSLGCRAMSGAGMVMEQAASAFRLFTGALPDIDRMRAGT
jgi:shikimate dehydrogenase